MPANENLLIESTHDRAPERARSSAKSFAVGMVTGGVLMFFFHGLVVKMVLLAALVVLAIALARRL